VLKSQLAPLSKLVKKRVKMDGKIKFDSISIQVDDSRPAIELVQVKPAPEDAKKSKAS